MKKLLMKVNKNFIIFGFFVIFLILILLFYNGNNSNIIPEDTTVNIETINLTGYNLVDVLSGDKFFIKADVPIILETFAVWCPTCLRQQKEIKKLHEEIGSNVVSISLNIDPNENEDLILDHANSNSLSWRFAISPTELTKQLIDKFGNRIISAPSAPVVIICPNLEYNFLGRGVKSSEKLKEEILFCND